MSTTKPPISWRRSTHSANNWGECVEVAVDGSTVRVRDSKNVPLGELAFMASRWSDFVEGVKAGEFDYPVQ